MQFRPTKVKCRSLVVVQQKSFYDEYVHLALRVVHFHGWGHLYTVGMGEFDWVFNPTLDSVHHGLHIQSCDHYKSRKKIFSGRLKFENGSWNLISAIAKPHREKECKWVGRDCKIFVMGGRCVEWGVITLLLFIVLPSHCLKPSSPTAIWSGGWNNSDQ